MHNNLQADPDVLAVQNLLSQSDDDADLETKDRIDPVESRFDEIKDASVTKEHSGDAFLQSAMRWVSSKVKSYEPNRKVIFWTALALLIVLRPGLIFGWALFAGFILLICYLLAGPDRFWRRVIALHRSLTRRNPRLGRLVKVRAYLFAKKWDCIVDWLPQGLSDILKCPDLRGLVSAEARHDSALADRLSRMDHTTATR